MERVNLPLDRSQMIERWLQSVLRRPGISAHAQIPWQPGCQKAVTPTGCLHTQGSERDGVATVAELIKTFCIVREGLLEMRSAGYFSGKPQCPAEVPGMVLAVSGFQINLFTRAQVQFLLCCLFNSQSWAKHGRDLSSTVILNAPTQNFWLNIHLRFQAFAMCCQTAYL